MSYVKYTLFFPNITGLGTAMEKESLLQKILIRFYKLAYKNASCIFFQNEENYNFFIRNKIDIKKTIILSQDLV